MSLTAPGQNNHKENNYLSSKTPTGKAWVKSNVSASKKPTQWQLGKQTVARIFCRDGEDYDAPGEKNVLLFPAPPHQQTL